MRLKDASRQDIRRWRKLQEDLGYLPHYRKIGKLLIEVSFIVHRQEFFRVTCLARGEQMSFRRNGTPLGNATGRLVGPLIQRRKVKT